MASVLQTMREGSGTQHPEEIINFLTARLVTTSGTFDKASNHFLVEESDTPAMSVDVRQGYAFIAKSNNQMVYPVWLKTEDATVAITANSSGNQRIDALVLYIDLGATANAAISNVAKLAAVAGTPAASPSAPDDTAIQAAIGASNPYTLLAYVTVDSGETTILDADISDERIDATYTSKVGSIVQADGWIPYTAVTPTRASADDPTYAFTFAGVDLTSLLTLGMKVKWTQDGTVRYGFITKIAFSTDTTLTIYGGTDYNVEDTATYSITGFYYSTQKAPVGFPLSPAKWAYTLTTTTGSQASPTANVWYNLGGSGSLHIGVWVMTWYTDVSTDTAAAGVKVTQATVSTANNSETDSTIRIAGTFYDIKTAASVGFREFLLTATTKTTYYVNARTTQASQVNLYLSSPHLLKATCAYL